WQQQPWYPAWAATSERKRREQQDRADAERRVALLRSDSLDPDMLDERVRAQLDYADPHDLVRMIKN
ncbi:MAG TPA: hypothetical protein VKT80_11535, partial [Chloroflexota bacterium]|nr:hypothetical protein [Chloroflexota bacterium]